MRADPRDRERALRLIAGSQAGYFSAAQARSVGYGTRLQHFHSVRGNWERVDRGVYRFPDFPHSEHEDLVRWALWSRNRRGEIQAVASHETALAVHELGDVMPVQTHLTVPPGFRKPVPPACVLHRASLGEQERESREGFLLTTALRTLTDVAMEDLPQDYLNGAVRDALRRGFVGRRELVDATQPAKARARLIEAIGAMDEGLE